MNKEQPDLPAAEKGVSAWIKVPTRRPPLPEFSADFRVLLQTGGRKDGDDVTPARPIGKVAFVGLGQKDQADLSGRCGAGGPTDHVCAKLDKDGGVFMLTMLPSAETGEHEIEIGPLSFSQGWHDGCIGYEGDAEGQDHAKNWWSGSEVILISLISPRALDHPSHVLGKPRSGVFAWVKLPRWQVPQAQALDFEMDFVAQFHPRGGNQDGSSKPTPPAWIGVSATNGGLLKLASIDLESGQWTLYAKGAASGPSGACPYEVVAGSRSQARDWIESHKAWRDDAAALALITLTNSYERL